MNLKWLRIPIVIAIALAMLIVLWPATTAHAGFVTNEEPTGSTVSYANSSGGSTIISGGANTTGTGYQRKSVFPMVGNWIIQPGKAFKLQFYFDINSCICVDKHNCMDYKGEVCY